jgi:hypothetical protein
MTCVDVAPGYFEDRGSTAGRSMELIAGSRGNSMAVFLVRMTGAFGQGVTPISCELFWQTSSKYEPPKQAEIGLGRLKDEID